MDDEPVQVAIFFTNEKEQQQADAALEPLAEKKGRRDFSGVVEGWVMPIDLKGLLRAGLPIQLLDAADRKARRAPESRVKEIEALAEDSRYASLNPESDRIIVDDQLAAVPDSSIHQYGDFDVTEAPAADEPAAAYFLELSGPITRDQRLEFFHQFGVDIGAFEPPNRYRAFLTPEQYAQVRRLPYVTRLVRYSLADSVTPELLELATEAPTPGPSLLAAAEEPIHTFDCLLHRERDLPMVRDLIEQTAETTVVDASNLRIRFQGPVNRPLLGALAALPAVRKLSPYEAPTL